MPTTPRGAPYPQLDGEISNDVPIDLKRLADWVDAHPGVSPLTSAQRDALTGTALWDGRVILNLSTGQLERRDAAAEVWRRASVGAHSDLSGLGADDHPQYFNSARHNTPARHGAGVVDHGSIGGLGDDDHPQYLPKTGGTLTDYREALAVRGSVSGEVTVATAAGNVHALTLAGDVAVVLGAATPGRAVSLTVVLTQDGAGGRVVSWPASVRWPDGEPADVDDAPGGVTVVALVTLDAGATWLGFPAGTRFA